MAQIILDSNNNLIQGDFDNATLNNRTKLQTTTTNATTNVYVVPNGSSTSAGVSVANNSSLTNASKIVMATNGTTDTQIISGVNGSGSYLPLSFYTNNALAMQLSTGGSLGVGTSNPSPKITVARTATTSVTNASYYLGLGGTENLLDSKRLIGMGYSSGSTDEYPTAMGYVETDNGGYTKGAISFYTRDVTTNTAPTERMRIASNGDLWLATGQYTTGPATSSTLTGFLFGNSGELQVSRTGNTSLYVNRTTNDGGLVSFRQDGFEEGSISVSGTTVSYNGGHLSRWSQWQNETGKPNVYRGTILESTNNMCEWEKDGEPLPNEQATKTIVSTTVASKAVAGVFDRYDEDDEDNPYDFYVAQSGDFVIRIAQGVTVQNGDLLESAGDGTAKPQTDDICRSSTIAKVTSNYVSATYEDGSYCVPCILMIG